MLGPISVNHDAYFIRLWRLNCFGPFSLPTPDPFLPLLHTQKHYWPAIDGLRALAVLAVMVHHMDRSLLPGGYLGVDVFYLILGFVITQSLLGRPAGGFLSFISGFFARRARRLLPALLVFVLVTSLATSCFDPSAEPTLLTGMASLVGLSNLLLFYKSTDYFGLSSELNGFTHTWSLGVEEQFYVVYPFLFWWLGIGLEKSFGLRAFRWLVVLLSVFSLAAFAIL